MIKFTLPFLLIIFIFVITISINAPSIEAQEDVDGFAPIVTYEGPLVFSVNLPAAADHMSPRSFVNSGSGEVNLGNVYSNIEKSDDSDVDRYDFTSFGKYQHSGSWTNVVPFVINEKPYVLFYDLLSGNYVIDCISASGAVSIQEDVFNSGITHFAFFELDGDPYLFTYYGSPGNGKFHIEIIIGDGTCTTDSITFEMHEWGNWTSNWSHFVTFELDGIPYLFTYKQNADGIVKIHPFIKNPETNKVSVGGLVFEADWREGWRNFVSFNRVDNGEQHAYLFGYRGQAGEDDTKIWEIKLDGTCLELERLFSENWSNNWSHFGSLHIHNEPYIFAYKLEDQVSALHRILFCSDGTIDNDEIWRDKAPGKFTHIATFPQLSIDPQPAFPKPDFTWCFNSSESYNGKNARAHAYFYIGSIFDFVCSSFS